MSNPFETICREVGIMVIGDGAAQRAVEELLPAINLPLSYARRAPRATAREITAYLDSLVRNP